MTMTVSQTASQTNNRIGANVLGAIAKRAPGAIKTIVHCGFEAAKLPLKESKNLASQFSGISMSTPAGDMLMGWTQDISEKGSEKATKWTISATDFIAKKVAGR